MTEQHAPFQFHPRMDDYLVALAAYRLGALVPVLGRPGPDHQAVIGLSEPRPRRPMAEPGELLVTWPASSKAADIAQALAQAVNGRAQELLDPADLGRASGSARHVVLVALAEEVDERALIRMHDSLWEQRGASTGGHLGLVVGAEPEQLSWIIAKGLALPHRAAPELDHLRIWPAAGRMARRYGTGQWVLREEATASTVRPLLLGTHSAALSLLAHGRDDVVHLTDTVICPIGAHRIQPASASAAHAPVCAFTGRCYRPDVANESIVLANQVRADVVFANSCMGMRIGEGLYPQEYLMPHGFVRGIAAAYLATGQLINGLLKVNDIFHTACATGRTLGEAATLINDHLRFERLDLPYYTLLGLPWLTVGQASAESDRAWREFVLGPAPAPGEGGALRAAANSLGAAETGGTGTHVLHLSGRARAVLGEAVADRIDPAAVPDLGAMLRGVGRALTNLEDVAFTGLRYSRQGNMLVNVRDQVTSLSQALHHAALMGDTERIRRRIGAISTAVQRAELTLAEALFERGVQSIQRYNDVWGTTLELHSPELTDQACPYCDRLTVRQEATHPILGRIGRDARICPRCGMIRDADRSAPLADLVLDTPEIWRRDEQRTVRLRFHLAAAQDGGRPATVAASVFMTNAAKNGMEFPRPQLVELSPDGAGELRVEVPVSSSARMHQEYIRGLVVAEGTISFVARPVWVRPAG